MKTVFRYELKQREFQAIKMPENAKILFISFIEGYNKYETLNIWAEVDTDNKLEVVKFMLFKTGASICNIEQLTFIGSAKKNNQCCFHLYKIV